MTCGNLGYMCHLSKQHVWHISYLAPRARYNLHGIQVRPKVKQPSLAQAPIPIQHLSYTQPQVIQVKLKLKPHDGIYQEVFISFWVQPLRSNLFDWFILKENYILMFFVFFQYFQGTFLCSLQNCNERQSIQGKLCNHNLVVTQL